MGFSSAAECPYTVPSAFEYVCEQAENIDETYTCDGLEPPIVVISWIVADHVYNMTGVYRGMYYPGEPYIFIRPDIEEDALLTVLLHETAHYVLHNNGVTERCLGEKYARFIAGQTAPWEDRYNCEKD